MGHGMGHVVRPDRHQGRAGARTEPDALQQPGPPIVGGGKKEPRNEANLTVALPSAYSLSGKTIAVQLLSSDVNL